MSGEAREEIVAAIRFYESKGWCWLKLVAFLSAKATDPKYSDYSRRWM